MELGGQRVGVSLDRVGSVWVGTCGSSVGSRLRRSSPPRRPYEQAGPDIARMPHLVAAPPMG